MKKVLSHVYKCSTPADALVSNCRETFCFSSKVVILHWRSCVVDNCVLCTPLRQADALLRKSSTSLAPSTLKTSSGQEEEEKEGGAMSSEGTTTRSGIEEGQGTAVQEEEEEVGPSSCSTLP